jgi:hypothetical protein
MKDKFGSCIDWGVRIGFLYPSWAQINKLSVAKAMRFCREGITRGIGNWGILPGYDKRIQVLHIKRKE